MFSGQDPASRSFDDLEAEPQAFREPCVLEGWFIHQRDRRIALGPAFSQSVEEARIDRLSISINKTVLLKCTQGGVYALRCDSQLSCARFATGESLAIQEEGKRDCSGCWVVSQ